jgi:hypothetical protein
MYNIFYITVRTRLIDILATWRCALASALLYIPYSSADRLISLAILLSITVVRRNLILSCLILLVCVRSVTLGWLLLSGGKAQSGEYSLDASNETAFWGIEHWLSLHPPPSTSLRPVTCDTRTTPDRAVTPAILERHLIAPLRLRYPNDTRSRRYAYGHL